MPIPVYNLKAEFNLQYGPSRRCVEKRKDLLNRYKPQKRMERMQARQERNTVERLDRPSAYYLGKVVVHSEQNTHSLLTCPKNKKRRHDDRDGAQSPQQEPEDPLANATTLYVGNLYVQKVPEEEKAAYGENRSFYTTEEQIHELFAK